MYIYTKNSFLAILKKVFISFIFHLIYEQKGCLCYSAVILIIICRLQLRAHENKSLNIQTHKQHLHEQTKLAEGSRLCHHYLDKDGNFIFKQIDIKIEL